MNKKTLQAKRRPRWRLWLYELLIIVIIVFLFRSWQQRDLLSGEAVSFIEQSLDGQVVSLEDYRGKPVLLHFWAQQCTMCEFGQGAISRVSEKWPVISIAFDSSSSEELTRYAQREEIDEWLTIPDPDGEMAARYGVKGVPVSFILDDEGIIRFHEVGLTSSWGLQLRLWITRQFF